MIPKPQWKHTLQLTKETEYESHFRDGELGICCVVITPRAATSECKPRRFAQIEGDSRTFRSISACLRALVKKRKWKAKTG